MRLRAGIKSSVIWDVEGVAFVTCAKLCGCHFLCIFGMTSFLATMQFISLCVFTCCILNSVLYARHFWDLDEFCLPQIRHFSASKQSPSLQFRFPHRQSQSLHIQRLCIQSENIGITAQVGMKALTLSLLITALIFSCNVVRLTVKTCEADGNVCPSLLMNA